jgi:hypothetical protein
MGESYYYERDDNLSLFVDRLYDTVTVTRFNGRFIGTVFAFGLTFSSERDKKYPKPVGLG